MTKSIILFEKEKDSLKERFYLLMNLIVTNRTKTLFESYLFVMIFFVRYLSIFYSTPIKVLNKDENTSDMILNYISQVFRFRELLFNYPNAYKIVIYGIGIYLIFFTIYFIIRLSKINHKSIFNLQLSLLNYMLKGLCYILFNITLDLFTQMLCFGREYNKYLTHIKCNQKNNIIPFIIGLFNSIYITFIVFFL